MPTTLWAPWRMQYIEGPKPAASGCIFCGVRAAGAAERRERLVVATTPEAYVILNRYPYAAGHVMVVPERHVTTLEALRPDECDALFRLVRASAGALCAAVGAEALNVGINLGEAAGASVHAHLHVHLVPRWSGDNNFIAVVGDTRVLPQALDDTWQKLAPHFAPLERAT